MTTHTNCTHPATKAARAACRKGLAPTDVARIARSSALAAKANADDRSLAGWATIIEKSAAKARGDYSGMTYRFDTTICDRCSGTGFRPEYAGVYGGVCFKCNKSGHNPSKGLVLTRAGAAAKKAHDEWIADHLMILVTELEPGMKFRPSQSEGWKTVVSVSEPRINGYSISRDAEGNEIRTPSIHVTVVTQKMTYGLLVDSSVQRAATAEERNALITRIAGLKGTILKPKN